MASKREEERNEKIIRGLMKLPPNRRCINCNSMGPQYVCTNFWTFICTICSGIHREFTHRVKSVSMSKFTSQEVEALQNGGNQRARETYLKEWDLQRLRFPNSNNVDRVRDFIKAVYVDRKYAGGNKSDKLPKDVESEKFGADEARRASSYHSYSQSPPYDFQYEDRLNRKQGGPFSRKPGSDRSLYDRKAASFVYSPGRFSDHHFEDRFANEGSSSRVSDYSVSSGGDPIRSAPQSPNLQKDDGFSSPVSDYSREIDGLQRQAGNPYPEAAVKRDADRVPAPRPQRSVSSGSFGSFEKVTGSIQPVASGSALDGSIEPNLSVINNQNKAFAFPPPSQLSAENVGQFNNFKDPFGMPASSPASTVDLLEAPATGSAVSIDLFQSPDATVFSQKFPPSSSSSYFHENSQDSSVSKSNQKISEPSETANEGWATFDLPQLSEASTRTSTPEVTESHSEIGIALKDFDSFSSSNVGLPWSAFQNVPVHESTPSVSNSWDEGMRMNITTNEGSSEWKAFEETIEQRHSHLDVQGTGLPVPTGNTSSTFELFQHPKMAEDTADGIHKHASNEGFSFPTLPSHVSSGSTFNQPNHPFLADLPNTGNRSVNPFDASFDSEFEANNTFLNMSSLQSTLPSTRLPTPYAGGINESWFPVNPLEPQGPMSFITAQAPSSQLTNVSHEPVASVGGNPFA